ncbi:MAG: formylglycine-generating enzyme family protein [Thermoanaerobaculia bacterium]
MSSDHYTAYPRPILWLVPEGELTAPFYLSKLPVTNEQFEAFDPGFERSALAAGDRDPALGVSWHDAAEYCAWYAEVSRKPIRLPAEEEWEHACRAGAHGRWFFGEDPAAAEEFVWHAGNSGDAVPPLDAKRTNGFGLHAMLGGVWEWTASPAEPASPAASAGGPAVGSAPSPAPPTPGPSGPLRILRGGSFRTPLEELSCSVRRAERPDLPVADAGFRIARSFR